MVTQRGEQRIFNSDGDGRRFGSFDLPSTMSAQGDKRAKLFGVKQQQVEEDNVGSDDEFEKSKVESYHPQRDEL